MFLVKKRIELKKRVEKYELKKNTQLSSQLGFLVKEKTKLEKNRVEKTELMFNSVLEGGCGYFNLHTFFQFWKAL